MCKEIAPNDGERWTYRGKPFRRDYPRTVKSNIPLPEGITTLVSFEHLEPFPEARLDEATGECEIVPITRMRDGVEMVFVHTCKRVFLSPEKNNRFGDYHFYGTWVRKGGPWDRTKEFFPDCE